VTSEADSERNKGGRPPTDADDFWIEIVRIANTPDGLPEDETELKKRMLEFQPERSESWVRGKLTKLWKGLRKP
jgi:hypothetical protein